MWLMFLRAVEVRMCLVFWHRRVNNIDYFLILICCCFKMGICFAGNSQDMAGNCKNNTGAIKKGGLEFVFLSILRFKVFHGMI